MVPRCWRGYNGGMAYELVDMHCHLDFLDNPVAFARDAANLGMAFFSSTVTPAGYERACGLLAGEPNVRVGVGLHPWWVDDGRCGPQDVERACELVLAARYVGEVGLDFGKRHVASREQQVKAFERIARTCAREGGKLLSVHSVKSADVVLDVLESTGCLASNEVILHWYSGSDVALRRAISLGCRFSVGARMLATKRGREYVKLIPADRMLLETDLPPGEDTAFPLDAWQAELRETQVAIEQARGPVPLAATSRALLLLP